jgi:hypothetical protein
VGEFRDNFMNGEGHYVWGDGRQYSGNNSYSHI